ncbi:MAG: hypothetical protein ACOVQE_01165 [Chitinophagaceae bacterium]
MNKSFLLFAVLIIALSSCKKETAEAINPNDKGELTLKFDNVVGDKNLQLNTGSYTNAVGESYRISMLNYL